MMKPTSILFLSAIALSVACSDEPDPVIVDNDTDQSADVAGEEDAGNDEGVGMVDAATDDVGNGGEDSGTTDMGDLGPADLHARFIVINQTVYREDKFFAQGGLAVFEIYNPQELPIDDRTEFFNADNERCTLESGTEWPQTLANGETWPAGPFIDAGNLTLTATGAPGDVVYAYFDTYYLRNAPGPVQVDGVTHNSFFPPEYIPHGSSATLSANGADISGFEMSGLTLASDYTVSSPALEAGGDLIDNTQPLVFQWSPGDENSRMAVIVKSGFNFVKCVFEDDGEATVPADAMSTLTGGQFVTYTIQTWRERTEIQRVVAEDGTVIDVMFLSRNAQIGRFDAP